MCHILTQLHNCYFICSYNGAVFIFILFFYYVQMQNSDKSLTIAPGHRKITSQLDQCFFFLLPYYNSREYFYINRVISCRHPSNVCDFMKIEITRVKSNNFWWNELPDCLIWFLLVERRKWGMLLRAIVKCCFVLISALLCVNFSRANRIYFRQDSYIPHASTFN